MARYTAVTSEPTPQNILISLVDPQELKLTPFLRPHDHDVRTCYPAYAIGFLRLASISSVSRRSYYGSVEFRGGQLHSVCVRIINGDL